VSDDGVDFRVETEPVLFPDEDRWQPWEWSGGCEDPRVVESPDGGYVCTYTGFDGKVGTLMIATSTTSEPGEARPAFVGTPHARRSSKSGSVVTELVDGRLVAHGSAADTGCTGRRQLLRRDLGGSRSLRPAEFDATGDRYLIYEPGAEHGPWDVQSVAGHRALLPTLSPRRGRFDSLLVEPGPPALRTADGIVLIYNGANHGSTVTPHYLRSRISLVKRCSTRLILAHGIARVTEPFLRAETVDEHLGQVADVCFAQGLVLFGGEWRLYFGMATRGSGAHGARSIIW